MVDDSDDEKDVKPILRKKGGRTSGGKVKDEPSTPVKKEPEEMDWEAVKVPGRRMTLPRASKGKAVKKPTLPELDSDSDDSIDDFIVYSDEDEDEKDKIKAAKAHGRLATRPTSRRKKEDVEAYGSEAEESDQEDRKPNLLKMNEDLLNKPMAKPLASFLPSAKMLVSTNVVCMNE